MTRKRPAESSDQPSTRPVGDDGSPDEPVEADGAPSQKKERVLHTRVPAVLEQELKRFARNLRVPVSNVVRAILEDALQVADRASGEVEQKLRDAVQVVSSERRFIREKLSRHDPLEGVIGYQPLVMAQDTECASCRAPLSTGDRGWLGLTAEPGPRVIVCSDCVPSPGSPGTPSATAKERSS